MDADAPVNIRTLGETTFNPELSDELNLNFGFHYSATSTLMQHVLREMDGRTLFRLYAMHMGLFGEASLAEMLEEQRRDVCPVCLFGDFEVLSKVLIMPCCGTRYHPDCINPCSNCPTCRCKRPTIGWVGFQTWVSYFTWDDWRGRIDRILQNDPVRAIVPLIRALHGTHSDILKSYAVTELINLVPQYSVHMEEAGLFETLVDLIYDNDLLRLGRAAKNSIIYELHEQTIELFGRLCRKRRDLYHMPGSWYGWIRSMLEGDNSSHIIVALKILRRGEPAAFLPFADTIVSLLKHKDPRVREEALSLLEVVSEIGATVEHVPLLVAMLSAGGADDVKHVAARALGMLAASFNDETILAIVQAGAIPPLVAMLSASGEDEGKEDPIVALYNLSMSEMGSRLGRNFTCNDNNIVAIAQAGAIPPLVMMLRAVDDNLKVCATLLLGNLSINNNNKVDVARAGAIPYLVLRLRVGEETTSSACIALWRLSTSNNDNKVLIASAGAIPRLVEMLIAGNRTGRTNNDHWDSAFAALVLGELSNNNDEYKVTIALAGAIPPLVAMLGSRFDNVMKEAMNTLRNLWSDNDNKMAIVQAGAISRFAEIRNSRSTDADVREAAAEAMRILSDLPASG